MPFLPSPSMARENGVFLRALRQTGNARLSAAQAGRDFTTFFRRRKRYPGFAADWATALACAQAALTLGGGKRSAESGKRTLKARGGEIMVGTGRGRRIQIRRAREGWLTQAGEQAFLAALASSCNVALAAAAVGISRTAIDRRRRTSDRFRHGFEAALRMGYDRLNAAAFERAELSLTDEHYRDDEWIERAAGNPLAPSTFSMALQLLMEHRRVAVLGEARRDKRMGGLPYRVANAAEVARAIENALGGTRRAARYRDTGDWLMPGEEPLPPLPDLATVTGWSRARPDAKTDPDSGLALFGGWREAALTRFRKAG